MCVLVGATACVPNEFGDRHAARVERYLPSPFTPEDAAYARANNALGPPDGRTVAVGEGGYIILRFFRAASDGPGVDLRIYEVGQDGAEARAAFSADGAEYIEPPVSVSGVTTEFDLAEYGLDEISFVRIRGLDSLGPDPGFDLDAVESVH